MGIEEVEIAVIGAGPAGLIAAREASLRGVKPTVLEEHKEIGLPCHCAGLLSIKGLRKIGVPLDGPFVQNKVRGARFFSPSNLSFTVKREEPVACVVDRYLLDKFLAEQASRMGSLIKLNSRVRVAKRDVKGWILDINGYGKLRTKVLIDAEGVSRRILGMTGLKTPESRKLLRGLQVDIKGVNLDPDYVEVHFSSKLAPGLFAWVIPVRDDIARVGLACKDLNPRESLFKFIKKRFREFCSDIEILKFYSGLVITSGPIKRTFGNRLLVVGDSAGQVKPLTGGGVIFGGICAIIAGRVASEAIMSDRTDESFLRIYEGEWRTIIGKELKLALLARGILNKLSDKNLDEIFSIISKEEIYRELSEKGDMDFHAKSIMNIIKKRDVLKFLPVILKSILSS
ncbi:NAD(P)/FAD-dependent oxidoreductase [Candidatus Bathyarchaeota archaeon]|nr:NAD(P)/FAD-dependent oxidoreductase [Candidatus Bathyarchaeota archaeon]